MTTERELAELVMQTGRWQWEDGAARLRDGSRYFRGYFDVLNGSSGFNEAWTDHVHDDDMPDLDDAGTVGILQRQTLEMWPKEYVQINRMGDGSASVVINNKQSFVGGSLVEALVSAFIAGSLGL